MNKNLSVLSVLIILLAFPLVSLAQPGAFQGSILMLVLGLVNTALTILWIIAVAFVIIMFVIAGFKFMTALGDPSKVAEARMAVIWGVVGTAVIVLAWSVIVVIRIQIGV